MVKKHKHRASHYFAVVRSLGIPWRAKTIRRRESRLMLYGSPNYKTRRWQQDERDHMRSGYYRYPLIHKNAPHTWIVNKPNKPGLRYGARDRPHTAYFPRTRIRQQMRRYIRNHTRFGYFSHRKRYNYTSKYKKY